MTLEQRRDLVKKFRHLAAFQKECLDRGDWEEFDHLENQMKKMEEQLVYAEQN